MKSLIAFAFASLLATAARAETTTYNYPGWDAPGNDIEDFLSGNVANCAKTCLDRGNCSAADFDAHLGRCWLKSRPGATTRVSYSTLILKIIAGRDGVDYPGGDYKNIQTTSWQNCSRQCFTETQCKAFAYDKNTQTCWLKNAVVDASFESNSVGGKK